MKILTLIFVLTLGLMSVKGQEKVENPPRFVTDATGCDTTASELHTVFTEFNQNALEESFLIIIGRSAKGEKRFYNFKRISTITEYMLEQSVAKSKIIFTEAQPIDNNGYVEIYVNGRLLLQMKTRRNGNFCTYCCEAPI